MESQRLMETGSVASRLRGVVYTYFAANIAVAALLLTTVTSDPAAEAGHMHSQEIANAR